eukprot:TRINITY_DN16472_c0_g1_i17.p1 TRINITY_DN16472_c0_g1~~TRINITY_DN16472_c0_g1_i17.p1  ORF type:complete len:689 (+),score=125.02 TRINITY_DN16472_c0_g1_i17:223-2289(+)
MAASELVCVASVLGLGLAVYAGSISGMDWVFDDWFVVLQNMDLRPGTPHGQLWRHDYWGANMSAGGSHKSWRPVATLSLRANFWLQQTASSTGFHALNVGLHGACSVLVLWCFTGWLPRPARLLAALWFALHPVHTEAVASVSGRGDVLGSALGMAAVGLWQHSSRRGNDCHLGYLGAGLFMLGVLSKETALSLAAVMVSTDWLWGRQWMRSRWVLVGRSCLLVGIVLGYFWVRWMISGDRLTPSFWVLDNPAAHAPDTIRRMSYAYIHARYALLLGHPWPSLSADYSLDAIPLIRGWFDLRLLASVALYLVLAAIASLGARCKRPRPAVLWCWCWMVFCFVPATNIFTVATVLAERLLYLPSVGSCGLMGLALARASAGFGRAGFSGLYYLVLCCFLSAAACTTMLRCLDWRSEVTLFRSCVQAQPASSKCHFGLGNALRYSGDHSEAIGSYKEAIRIWPAHSDAYTNLAISLATLQHQDESRAALEGALRLDPKAADAYEQLAYLEYNQQRPAQAVSALGHQALIRRLSFSCLNLKGAAMIQLGKLNEAREAFRSSLELNGQFAETYNNMGILLQESGEHDQAVAHFQMASHLKQHQFAQPLFNQGVSLLSLNRPEHAVTNFKAAVALDQGYTRAHLLSAVALERLGRFKGARASLEQVLRLQPNNLDARAMSSRLHKHIAKPALA